jgi:hypothetical protein
MYSINEVENVVFDAKSAARARASTSPADLGECGRSG